MHHFMSIPYILLVLDCTIFSIIFKIVKGERKLLIQLEKVYYILAFTCAIIILTSIFFINKIFSRHIYPNPIILFALVIIIIFFSISFTNVLSKMGDFFEKQWKQAKR